MNESNITLYGCNTSSATNRVRIALRLKNISYDYIEIDLNKGEHHSSSFSKLNIQNKLPLLLHGFETLTQSLSIIEYLNEFYPESDLLPSSIEGRAWCRSFSSLFIADYHPLITRRVTDILSDFGLTNDDIKEWKQQWLMESLRVADEILSQRSKQHKFCCGDYPMLADICLYAQCESARKQAISLEDYKNISCIYNVCSQIEAFREDSLW